MDLKINIEDKPQEWKAQIITEINCTTNNLNKIQDIKEEKINEDALLDLFDESDPFKDEELEFIEFEGFPEVKRIKNEPLDLDTFDNIADFLNNIEEIGSSNIMKNAWSNFISFRSSDTNEIPGMPFSAPLDIREKLLELSSLNRTFENIEIKDEPLKFDTFDDSDNDLNIDESMKFDSIEEHCENKVKDAYPNMEMYQLLPKQNIENEDTVLEEKLFDSQNYAYENIDVKEDIWEEDAGFTNINKKEEFKVTVTSSSRLNRRIKNDISLRNDSKEAVYRELRNSRYPIVLVEKMNFGDKHIFKTDFSVSLVPGHENSQKYLAQVAVKRIRRKKKKTLPRKDIKWFRCDYTAHKKRNLNHHVLTHEKSNKARLQCPFCNYKSNWKSSIKKHVVTHSEVKMFRCFHCEYSSNRKDNLSAHLLIHSDQKLKCPICLNYETSCKRNLGRHLLTHAKNKLFRCSRCAFETNYKYAFEGHLIRHNDQTLLKEYFPSSTKKALKCDHCGYTTSAKRYLDAHARKHWKQKVLKCSYCDYKTNEKNNLKRHVLNHLGFKPHKCSECAYKTNDSSHLKRHVKLKHYK